MFSVMRGTEVPLVVVIADGRSISISCIREYAIHFERGDDDNTACNIKNNW